MGSEARSFMASALEQSIVNARPFRTTHAAEYPLLRWEGAQSDPFSRSARATALVYQGCASWMLMLPCSRSAIVGRGGHTMGFGGIEVMSRWNPSPLPPERPVSLTDQRTKEPAGAVFDDDSVICPMIPARFTPVMSGTT